MAAILCLLGMAQAGCGGSKGPEPKPGPPPAAKPATPAPQPGAAAKPTHLDGVPVYDPSVPGTKAAPPPEQVGTITPAGLRECTVDDMQVIKALIRKSSSAYVEGKYDEAIALSQRALNRCSNENYMAHQIIGASSCFKNDAPAARRSYAKIPPDKKELIEKVCSRAGIVLTP